MSLSKTRRQIAWEAARLMYQRSESEYYPAKMKAARHICKGWVKPADLPSNAEIRDEVLLLARIHEGASRLTNLKTMRLQALNLLEQLHEFKPRLIGSVLTGHVRAGSDIDIHVFTDSVQAVELLLDDLGMTYEVTRKQVRKGPVNSVFTHIHLRNEFPVELTLYPFRMARHPFKSSITGKSIERASAKELRQFVEREYPEMDLAAELTLLRDQVDRFQYFESLLYPLERIEQNPQYHPEGDALYHSLQVFDLAAELHPYDEEFLLAALLHDIGKAIDSFDHVTVGLEALKGFITERTRWLIENHMECHRIRAGTIGMRAHRRLKTNENYPELIQLGEIDRAGRVCGLPTSSVSEALAYIQNVDGMF